MKKIILTLLTAFMIFSLVACGQSEDDDDDRKKSKKKDKTKTEEVDEEYEDEESDADGEIPDEEVTDGEPDEDIADAQDDSIINTVVDVLFDVQFSDGMEYATLTGVTETGEAVWTYETSKYEVAQVDRLTPLGMYNDMFYYVEAGSVVAIHPQTAEVIWKNEEFMGSCSGYDFDEDGTLYLCGYFGPDLMVVDKAGKTVLRNDTLDADYYWPFEVEYENGYVFVNYECNSGYYWEEKYFWGNEEKLEYGGYVLSYCMADGSIGYEHNVLEPGLAYQGFYQRANGTSRLDEMQIDYLGENKYLISINLINEAYMANMIGCMENDTIIFSDECRGNSYTGMLNRNGESISLLITETDNGALIVGTEYLFGTDLAVPDPEAEEITSEELMTKIISISATSALEENGTTHVPEFAIDGDLMTGWVEGAAGQGISESLTITLDGEYLVKGFGINAGYQKSDSLYEKNSRPQVIQVILSDGTVTRYITYTLDDFYGEQSFELSEPSYISSITFTIMSVYPGSKYEDTVISEIRLY